MRCSVWEIAMRWFLVMTWFWMLKMVCVSTRNQATLKLTKSWTTHVSRASRPTGTVELLMGPLNLGSAVRKDDTKPNWLTFMAFIIRALNGADTKQVLGEFRGGL